MQKAIDECDIALQLKKAKVMKKFSFQKDLHLKIFKRLFFAKTSSKSLPKLTYF